MSETSQQLPIAEILDADRFMDYEAGELHRSHRRELVLGLIDRPGMVLCDVGGASGVFLSSVVREAAFSLEPWIVEVDESFRERQVSKASRFHHASILDSGLPDGVFDIVTFRHVLHHLVSNTVARTLELQRRALAEMVRLLAPGGHLVFQEQVNRVRPFSRAVYFLSYFFSRHRLSWRYFEAGTVVVSFMTPAEVKQAVALAGPVRVSYCAQRPRADPLRWKLTVLMAFGADVFYVVRKEATS